MDKPEMEFNIVENASELKQTYFIEMENIEFKHVPKIERANIEREIKTNDTGISVYRSPIKKKIVYVAHPISGDVLQNLRDIQMHYQLISAKDEVIPFVPYYATVMSLDDADKLQRQKGFSHNEAIFRSGIIDEIWLFGSKISSGMQQEIIWANELNIPVISKSEGTKI